MPRGPSSVSAKEKILKEAEMLILLHGLNGTSLNLICANAKVTKGGFFHHFDSKEAMASEILRKYWFETVAAMNASRHLRSKDPLKKLIGVLTFFEELFEIPKRPSACLIGNITQEVALTNDTIRLTCDEIFSEWTLFLTNLIQEAVASRGIKEKLDAKGLAELIIASVEGAFTLVKATGDLKSSRRTIAHLKNYIVLLFQ